MENVSGESKFVLPVITVSVGNHTFEAEVYGWVGDDFVVVDRATEKIYKFTRAEIVKFNKGRSLDSLLGEFDPTGDDMCRIEQRSLPAYGSGFEAYGMEGLYMKSEKNDQSMKKGYWTGVKKNNGTLEVDVDRGVVYFHSKSPTLGVTLLRICKVPRKKIEDLLDGLMLDIVYPGDGK